MPQTAPRRRNRLRWLAFCRRSLHNGNVLLQMKSLLIAFAKGQTRRPHPLFSSLLSPVQCLPFPDVEVSQHQDHQKDEHLDQPEETELVEEDRPGKKKDRLNIENHEENGDQKVTNGETCVESRGRRRDSRLVSFVLGLVGPPHLNRLRQEDRRQRQSCRQQGKDENREIVFHVRPFYRRASGSQPELSAIRFQLSANHEISLDFG
jgi:hypothetical protein